MPTYPAPETRPGWYYVRVLKLGFSEGRRWAFEGQGVLVGFLVGGPLMLGVTWLVAGDTVRPGLNAGTVLIAAVLVVIGWLLFCFGFQLFRAPALLQREVEEENRRLDNDLQRLGQKPTSGHHTDQLKRCIQALVKALQGNRLSEFGDKPGRDMWRRSFGSHFPDQGQHFARWDDLVIDLSTALGSCEAKFRTQLERNGFVVWADSIMGWFHPGTIGRAREGRSSDPFPFDWEHADGIWKLRVPRGDAAQISPIFNGSVSGDEVAAAKEKFELLFAEAQTWSEVQAIPALETQRQEVKAQLHEELDKLLAKEQYFGQCDVCATQS